jgi:enoyl-CoA hydratase
MMGYRYLRWAVDGAIATVTMSRPPVNAVSQEMYRELTSLFSDGDRFGAHIKVVVLCSDVRHFCAGNELEEFATLAPDNSDGRMAEVRAAFFAIQNCPVPVIAAVNGAALGTGLAIAASCDFVIAAQDARFGTPEVSVGIMGGAKHLSRLVPEPWVRWMYFTAEPVAAAELARLGGIIAVVPADELLAAAHEHAALVARHSGAVLRMAKRSLNAIETMDLQPGYTFEQSLTTEISGHPDSQEAVRATLERRAPDYPSDPAGASRAASG